MKFIKKDRQVVQNGAEASAPEVFSIPRETVKCGSFDLFVELRMCLITGLLNDKHRKENSPPIQKVNIAAQRLLKMTP